MDAQRAISLVRSKAKEWNLDPKRIGMLGFSAGGHLTAWTSTNFDKRSYEPVDDVDKVSCRPDFTILIYPAYLVTKDMDGLKPDIRVTKDTPPYVYRHGRRRSGSRRKRRRNVSGAEKGRRPGRPARLRLRRPRLRPASERQALPDVAAKLRRTGSKIRASSNPPRRREAGGFGE